MSEETKVRYRAKQPTALDQYGTFAQGELIDTKQVPHEVLEDLKGQGIVEYVDTLKWNPTGHGGEGAWEAQPEPSPEPVVAKTTEGPGVATPQGGQGAVANTNPARVGGSEQAQREAQAIGKGQVGPVEEVVKP